MFEIPGRTFVNMSLKSEHESDGVSTWEKLDGFTYKHCFYVQKYILFVCKLHC